MQITWFRCKCGNKTIAAYGPVAIMRPCDKCATKPTPCERPMTTPRVKGAV